MMKENYKSQNTNYKQNTKYKLQITKLLRNWNDGMVQYWNIGMLGLEYCENAILTKGASPLVPLKSSTTEGSYGLHQGTFRLQTMTALMKSFCGGSRGVVFSKRTPLAAGGLSAREE